MKVDRTLIASMGPRLFSRGDKAATTTKAHSANPLQWGRGCSAAEIGTLPLRAQQSHCRLQWGRGCSAAEITIRRARKCGRTLASMGPRLFSRGD